jgi:hypothetical protein
MQVEGIREAHIEWAGKAQFLADPHGQDAAVYEYRAVVRGRLLQCGLHSRVLNRITVHRGKEADRVQSADGDYMLGQWIDHGVREKAVRIGRGCRHGGSFVGWDAGDEGRAVDSVAVQLPHPAVGQVGGILGRQFPIQRRGHFGRGLSALGAEGIEKSARKEVHVRVRDRALTPGCLHQDGSIS